MPFISTAWTKKHTLGNLTTSGQPNPFAGPGHNVWDQANVVFNRSQKVTLTITAPAREDLLSFRKGWKCAEIISTKNDYGYGKYTFEVDSPINNFDENIILGMFVYFSDGRLEPFPSTLHSGETVSKIGNFTPHIPSGNVLPVLDGTHEITVEVAKWGEPYGTNGNFTVFPANRLLANKFSKATFPIITSGKTRYTFDWKKNSVHFECCEEITGGKMQLTDEWIYAPLDPLKFIPTPPMQVHINLWLRGDSTQEFYPVIRQNVSVILSNFTYIP